jgi:tetratricopeptide (TPR) repeat protein
MNASPSLGLIAAICALIGGLSFADLWLARLEKREVSAQTEGLYHEGESLLKQHKPLEALEPLRKAHSLDRLNPDYQLGLTDAQIASGLWPDARATLGELLERDSNDARANLFTARLSAAEKRLTDADSYYHRAIYGKWPAGEQTSGPQRARLELADFLASRGAKASLLSETLLLEREQGANPEVARRVPDLLMLAGAYPQAVSAYLTLAHRNPEDPEPEIGLGKADLASGNYHEARLAFGRARKLKPGDEDLIRETALSESLISLDPTPRRLSAREKYDRSVTLLQQIMDSAHRCFATQQGSAEGLSLLAEGDRVQSLPQRGTPTEEMSEAILSLSERLWKSLPESCRNQSDKALPLIMQKVGR